MYNNLNDILYANSIKDNKGITFILGDDKEVFVSYGELYKRALGILYHLQLMGIKQGDELVFQIEDNESFIYYFWACLLGKIIPVPVTVGNNNEHRLKLFKIWRILNSPYLAAEKRVLSVLEKYSDTDDEIVLTLNEMQKRMILTDDIKGLDKQGTVCTAGLNDIAFLQFSSGSTGEPKGVILTHENLLVNLYAAIECSKTDSNDSMLSWMPLTHDMGMIGFHLLPLVANLNQYIMPTSLFIRRPTLWLKKSSQHKITVTSSPNFGYRYFLSFFKPEAVKDWDLSNIRIIYNGAEPISADLCYEFLDKMASFGLKRTSMYTVYGMAEAAVAVAFPTAGEEFKYLNIDRNSINVCDKVKEVSKEDKECVNFVKVGYPVTNCNVRIRDNNNLGLPSNVIGNIQISGKNVTSGYYNNEEATKNLFADDEWINTGDLGFIHEGSLVITGRAKDIIFVNGQNYYPHDIERVAEKNGTVELGEIAACGVTNYDYHKDDIVLFVVFKKCIEEFIPLVIEMKSVVSQSMGIEVTHVVPIKKLPKTTSGKIQRYVLIERYKKGEFNNIISDIGNRMKEFEISRHIEKPGNEIEEQLHSICIEVLGGDNISINQSFSELGGDSTQLANISAKIDELYPGVVKISDFYAYPTIAKLAGYIKRDDCKVIKCISLPGEFFDTAGAKKEQVILKYEIDKATYQRLKFAPSNEGRDLSALLLSVFMFILSEFSGEKNIMVQTMLDSENSVCSQEIDLNKFTDLTEMSQYIVDRSAVNEAYKISELENMRIYRSENSILPFMYMKPLLKTSSNLPLYFDILIEIDETPNSINLLCKYNSKLLKKEKIQELFGSYIRVVKLFADN